MTRFFEPIGDLPGRPLVFAAVVASVLGIGMLILQRWVAGTRDVAIVLVLAWFAIVMLAALGASRDAESSRRAALATLTATAAVTVVVGYWTGFRETIVDEDVAIATMRASGADLERGLGGDKAEPEGDAAPVELASAPIRGADGHDGQGVATVVEQADGRRVLTLTDFEVDPGPDVDVYLSAAGSGVDDAINLGDLKGTNGDQQYEIPTAADLTRYRALVLWCTPFTTRIATAELLD